MFIQNRGHHLHCRQSADREIKEHFAAGRDAACSFFTQRPGQADIADNHIRRLPARLRGQHGISAPVSEGHDPQQCCHTLRFAPSA